jgi:hypothetical protein
MFVSESIHNDLHLGVEPILFSVGDILFDVFFNRFNNSIITATVSIETRFGHNVLLNFENSTLNHIGVLFISNYTVNYLRVDVLSFLWVTADLELRFFGFRLMWTVE